MIGGTERRGSPAGGRTFKNREISIIIAKNRQIPPAGKSQNAPKILNTMQNTERMNNRIQNHFFLQIYAGGIYTTNVCNIFDRYILVFGNLENPSSIRSTFCGSGFPAARSTIAAGKQLPQSISLVLCK